MKFIILFALLAITFVQPTISTPVPEKNTESLSCSYRTAPDLAWLMYYLGKTQIVGSHKEATWLTPWKNDEA